MKEKVDWVCLTNTTGYAQAARDYVMALKDEYDLRVHALDHHPDESLLTRPSFEAITQMRYKPFDENAIQVFHCIPDMQRRRQCVKNLCKKRVGFATFETYDPPEHWANIYNKNDAVIAPSKFCKEVFEKSGVESPIFYMPHVVNTEMYHPDVEKSMPDENRFTFLYIAAFRERKNYYELIKAWRNFYSEREDVRLLIKTDHGDLLRHLIVKACHGRVPENIFILDHSIHEKEMPMLIKSADCLIHPSMGEGFGLPPLFAMAMKVPVAVAGHSGLLDYANEDNATIIKTGSMFTPKETMDKYPQFRKCKWPKVDYLKIYEAMHTILKNTENIKSKAQVAYEDVTHNYNYESARRNFREIVSFIRS